MPDPFIHRKVNSSKSNLGALHTLNIFEESPSEKGIVVGLRVEEIYTLFCIRKTFDFNPFKRLCVLINLQNSFIQDVDN